MELQIDDDRLKLPDGKLLGRKSGRYKKNAGNGRRSIFMRNVPKTDFTYLIPQTMKLPRS